MCVVAFGVGPASAEGVGIETATVSSAEAGSTQSATDTGPVTEAPDCGSVGYETDDGLKLVANASQLQCVSEDLDGDYRVVDDIDASGTDQWNDGDGFTPIGPFTGTFDGDNHTIKGLVIDKSSDVNGLFGQVGTRATSATVENVRLENVDVWGEDKTAALAAVVVNGTVVNSHAVAGSVRSITGTKVGGLVGVVDDGEIHQSHADVRVTATGVGGKVGGLVGFAYESVVSRSYANGEVMTNGVPLVGGLVGESRYTTINNSYATGDVEGQQDLSNGDAAVVGGLVGLVNRSLVFESYATGDVASFSDVGGLAGIIRGDAAEFEITSNGYKLLNSPLQQAGVSNTYATGDVEGNGIYYDTGKRIGGLVGSVEASGSVSQSYATGNVSSNDENFEGNVSSEGALVGHLGPFNWIDDRPVVEYAYQDSNAKPGASIGDRETVTDDYDVLANDVIYPRVENVSHLPTADMQGDAAASNMDTFEFGLIWTTVTAPDGYPVLRNAAEGKQASQPYFVVSSASVVRDTGRVVDVSAEVENTGSADGTQTIEFRVDTDDSGTLDPDEELATETVSVVSMRSDEVQFTNVSITSVPTGTHAYGVVSENDRDTRTRTFDEPDTLRVLADPTNLTAGESTNVSVQVNDNKSGEPVRGATVEVPALGVSTTTDFVGAAELTVSPNAAGNYTVTVTAQGYAVARVNLTVTGGSGDVAFSMRDYDTDGDGSLKGDLQGVLQALADYNKGQLTLQEILEVLALYNGG